MRASSIRVYKTPLTTDTLYHSISSRRTTKGLRRPTTRRRSRSSKSINLFISIFLSSFDLRQISSLPGEYSRAELVRGVISETNEGFNSIQFSMGAFNEDENAYVEFEKKVRRTVLFDNLAPQVTAQFLKTSLGQFGSVINVQFLPNYTIPQDIPQAALVEMENQHQARSLVEQMNDCPFMIAVMPRPVRAQLAKATNFADRPRRSGRTIKFQWLKPDHRDFDVAKRLKSLVRKHAAETSALLKYQLQEEEKLAKQQEEMLKTNYKKYELIEKALEDGSLYRLAGHYNIQIKDEGT